MGGNFLNMGKSDSSSVYFERAIPLYEKMNEKSFHKYDSDLAYAEYGLANNYYLIKDYVKADSVSKPVLQMYRQLASNKASSFNAAVAQVLALRGAILTDSGEYQTAEKEYKEALDIYTPLFNTRPDAFRYPLADCYEGVSKLYNLLSRFAEAEKAGRKGLTILPEKVTINTSLALALLYQGKFDEAKEIYLQFKDQRFARPGAPVTYADIFLEDLNTLEEKGITHADANKARKLLNRS
jgi:tetratricopeptide (TPR) repeat protein